MSLNFSYQNWDCLFSFVCVNVPLCKLYGCVKYIYTTDFTFSEAFLCVYMSIMYWSMFS